MNIPVVDIFAGPGGLGEGFAAYRGRGPRFEVALSVEKEKSAHDTLALRKFFHLFPDGGAPEAYYRYVRGEIGRDQLIENHQAEWNEATCRALHAELGRDNLLIDGRIAEQVSGRSSGWVLIGGPPCQAYSLVGRARRSRESRQEFESDPRQFLYREYLRILAVHTPAVFVMENVKGLTSAKLGGERIFDRILQDLRSPGAAVIPDKSDQAEYDVYSLVRSGEEDMFGRPSYQPADFVIRCEQYGIPQARHRVIILGIRRDMGRRPDLLRALPGITVEEAIGDLPRLRSGLSRRRKIDLSWRDAIRRELAVRLGTVADGVLRDRLEFRLNEIGEDLPEGRRFVASRKRPKKLRDWYTDARIRGACNHRSRTHRSDDLARYFYLACYAEEYGVSLKLTEFPEGLLPAHRNVSGKRNRTQIFNDRFRVQLRSKPASTVTSHISKDGHYFIHYDPRQCRSLTVREAARLQTFPDNYFFEGNRTEQYVQVGNAVPPYLAYQIASVVADILI